MGTGDWHLFAENSFFALKRRVEIITGNEIMKYVFL